MVDLIINWLIANCAATMDALWRVSAVTVKSVKTSANGTVTLKLAGIVPNGTVSAILVDGQTAPSVGSVFSLVCAGIDTISKGMNTPRGVVSLIDGTRGDNESKGFKLPARLHTKGTDIAVFVHCTYAAFDNAINGNASGSVGRARLSAIESDSFNALFG